MQRTKTYFIILSLFALVLIGCEKPPKACIDMSSISISVGDSIEFISCSENALSLDWTITGPTGAPENVIGWSDATFTNTFTVPGEYTVLLEAYEKFSLQGELSTVERSFTIN